MIRFTYGTQTAYDSLEFKDPDVLYCITDTMRIYKGTDLISDTCVKFVETVPTPETAVSGNLYVYAVEGQSPSLYVKVGNEVVQVPGGGAPAGNYLPLTGGTMTGPIDMGSNPITATQSSGTIQPNHLMTFGIFAETLSQMPEMFMGKSGSVWNANGTPVAAIPDLPDSPLSETYGNYAVNLNSLNSILEDKSVLKSGGQTLTGTYKFNSSTPGNHVLSLIDLSGSSGEVFYLDGRGGIHCASLFSEGSIQLNNSKITGVATPLEGTDAANKQYVDTAVSSQVSSLQSQIEAITQTLASLNISVAEI